MRSLTPLFLGLWAVTGCQVIDTTEVIADPTAIVVSFDTGGADGVSFAMDIEPIFNHYCTGCHSGSGAPGGLDLTDYATIMQLGVVTPEDSEGSLLYQFVSQGTMPPTGSVTLTDAELAMIAAWIDAGAPDN
ncbi:MAG: cytochrome c [Oligoflexia bacterium]|nr:cytochrome c [Oligoflexia bacterium]